ncbi:MAG: transcriptional repressor LexA [Pseudomonadota bacterium]|nr:transcriptional repressor LexA [Pseudomonadota bacterium]
MLTLMQHKVYRFIKDFTAENHLSPTTKEIAQGIGIQSRGVVHRYLKALEQADYITLVPNKRRNIVINKHDKMDLSIPLLGKIAAGMPIEAVRDSETVDVTNLFLSPGRYALRVKGESMLDEGIHDGDIIICQESRVAENGQIVVALIDEESATLKRIQKNKDRTVTLLPANSLHKPQTYDYNRVRIQGVFVGLLRLT